MKLLLGRPKTNEGRLPKEIRVYDLLDSLGIEYYRIDHNAANHFDDCEEIEKVLDEETNALLTKFGFRHIASIIYNIVMTFVTLIKNIIAVLK